MEPRKLKLIDHWCGWFQPKFSKSYSDLWNVFFREFNDGFCIVFKTNNFIKEVVLS